MLHALLIENRSSLPSCLGLCYTAHFTTDMSQLLWVAQEERTSEQQQQPPASRAKRHGGREAGRQATPCAPTGAVACCWIGTRG
ncbi:hypothetical protein M0804_011650 [Polistes exclamans]|nr:hypothetical protein M0804_011650 [Polistes exclamans]